MLYHKIVTEAHVECQVGDWIEIQHDGRFYNRTRHRYVDIPSEKLIDVYLRPRTTTYVDYTCSVVHELVEDYGAYVTERLTGVRKLEQYTLVDETDLNTYSIEVVWNQLANDVQKYGASEVRDGFGKCVRDMHEEIIRLTLKVHELEKKLSEK